MELIKDLNPQQQQAVMAEGGPVLVLAGPGSGKTRVLTQRIAYLIRVKKASPYSLMAVTFTNKAAREMESRVVKLIGEYARGLTLGTFHAICARILRREAEHLPFESNYVIFDEDDQLGLVKHALRDLNLDEKNNRPAPIHAAISNAKNELLLPENFPVQNYRDEVVRRVYERYQQLLLVNNALDFDDLLLWAVRLFEEHLEVREKYARRFEHILVDEFQDTNIAQYLLLKHLASFHRNIFVVGDTDQSIYRWRGADYRNVLRFEKDFPDAQIVMLEQNYRSTQAILNVAMAVISRHPQRRPKYLFTDRGEGLRVTLREVYDDRAEAAYVLDSIVDMVRREQAQPGDFAMMYRTNAQSRLLEEAFLAAGLPYKLVGAQRFYGRREVKDIIAYLRLVHNPNDELSLTRIINVPLRGIGDKTYLALRTLAQKLSLSPGELLLEIGVEPEALNLAGFPGRSGTSLARFSGWLVKWAALKASATPLALMDQILEDVDYRSYIDDGSEEGADRWANVMELRRIAFEAQDRGLEGFLEEVALVSDQDTLETTAKVPTMLTLHAAKGLEFPVVFIIGLNDGTLPHSRSFDDIEEMMEERRLFYVGITRAKDRLFLVYSQNRSAYGYPEPVDPSRFLDDIPYELIEEEQSAVYRRGLKSEAASPAVRWGSAGRASAKAPTPNQQRYHPGMNVFHPTYGDGMVLNSRIEGDDEVVDVFFADLGMKRLVASLARLEIKT